MNDWKIH